MNNNLLIVGAGQYGQVAKEMAEAMQCFKKVDFLDNNNDIAIGKLCDYEKFSVLYSNAIVAVENPEMRLNWIKKLEEACYKIAILIHPKAYVAPSAQIMKGSIIEPMAVINSGTVISVGCIVSAGAVINHNSYVCDGCHIDCNAVVEGNSLVPVGTYVECGAVFKRQEISAKDLFFEYQKEQNNEHLEKKAASTGPEPVNGREYCFEDGM